MQYADALRVIAHFLSLVCLLYLFFDDTVKGRHWHQLLWAALGIERFIALVLLALDVTQPALEWWMNYRVVITPASFIVFIALGAYTWRRIRQERVRPHMPIGEAKSELMDMEYTNGNAQSVVERAVR